MNVSSAAASISAMSLANVQAQAALSVLRKTLDLQQANAAQLLANPPTPASPPSGSLGAIVDTYV